MSNDNREDETLEQRIIDARPKRKSPKKAYVHISIFRSKFDEIENLNKDLSYERIRHIISQMAGYSESDVDFFCKNATIRAPRHLYETICYAEECFRVWRTLPINKYLAEEQPGAAAGPDTEEGPKNLTPDTPEKNTPANKTSAADEDEEYDSSPPKEFSHYHWHLLKEAPMERIPYFIFEAVVDSLIRHETTRKTLREDEPEDDGKTDIERSLNAIEEKAERRKYLGKGTLKDTLRERKECAPQVYGGLIAILAEQELNLNEGDIYVSDESLKKLTKPVDYEPRKDYAIGQILTFERNRLGVVLRKYRNSKIFVAKQFRSALEVHSAAKKAGRPRKNEPVKEEAAETKKDKSYQIIEYTINKSNYEPNRKFYEII